MFLAQNLELPKWSWHRAMYFIETATPSVRQCARICSYSKIDATVYSKKQTGETVKIDKKCLPQFYFAASEELIRFVKSLSEGFFNLFDIFINFNFILQTQL